jgi:outer membrane lipoprotein-sorting protein
MALSRWRLRALFLSGLLMMALLAACGETATKPAPPATPTPKPTPVLGQGQQLLTKTANLLNTAKTIHGLFHITITSQALNGDITTESWKTAPDKNRVEVHQSTLSQVSAGSVTVTDGKQVWQYDAQKNVVYTGPLPANTSGNQQNSGLAANGGGQSQSFLNLIQTLFNHSTGTLRPNATINGRPAYDVHVVPQNTSENGDSQNFNYTGEVYIDKGNQLPVKIDLDLSNQGKVVFDFQKLEINAPIAEATYTFTPPAGAKTRPLQDAANNPGTGSLTLAQAQKQAGYHLLSIPPDQADYVLNGVTALGIQGSQTYSLNYMKGNLAFTIAEGKPLANLPDDGQPVQLRGTNGTLATSNGISTLAWTENGVGIHITGKLENDQIVAIAQSLA